MENKPNSIDNILERAEQYGKTSFELIKLKAVEKTADITSTVVSHLLLALVVSLFALTLSIAIALWLGDMLGKNYYGFLLVASFYAVAGVVWFFIHPFIKVCVNNTIIKQFFN